mmetsp:Transcript_108587/g.187792  ORF Transcript_108587/g.187792 Transcript_108587/m.187792 type:complete len:100 (+) Transcript_108587:681-980(+)
MELHVLQLLAHVQKLIQRDSGVWHQASVPHVRSKHLFHAKALERVHSLNSAKQHEHGANQAPGVATIHDIKINPQKEESAHPIPLGMMLRHKNAWSLGN